MSGLLDSDFWPASLRRWEQPYVSETDEWVTIAEIVTDNANGFHGTRHVFTALIPPGDLDAVLTTPGGIGHEVQAQGPLPSIGANGGYRPSFWIIGHDGKRYDTIIHSWLNHNRQVVFPDNGLLMTYGLVPRFLDGEVLAWDDPRRPVYDVILVNPLSRYTVDEGSSLAQVTIRRDYLEDYLSLTGCVAVATFFEERWSNNDPEIEGILGSTDGTTCDVPGRTLWFKRIKTDYGNQLVTCHDPLPR